MGETTRETHDELSLSAPIDGVVVPLESLPDPVFAEKMMGDGISIDPTSPKLLAPCDGTIVQVHRAKHALTLRTEGGVSVLLHVGLDTVNLEGKGFDVLVEEGQVVKRRQPLIEFDLDAIAQSAASALTELIITEGGDRFSFQRREGRVVAGDDEVLRVSTLPPSAEAPPRAGGSTREGEPITIVNANGLHARPAGVLVSRAKSFSAEVTIHFGDKQARAKSVTEIMGLDLAKGDQIHLSARGADAEAALSALTSLFELGLGEDLSEASADEAQRFESKDPNLLGGIPGSPGLAIGRVQVHERKLPAFEQASSDASGETHRLERAVQTGKSQLEDLRRRFGDAEADEKAQIFAAQAEILDDAALVQSSRQAITRGATAAAAWQRSIDDQAAKLESLKSALMRQRADDLRDVGYRVMSALLDLAPPDAKLGPEVVLASDALTPSEVALLEPGQVAALLTAKGGSTSHAAIIARSLAVPYVAGLGESFSRLKSGAEVIIDGSQGSVRIEPNHKDLEAAQRALEQQRTAHEAALKQASRRVTTRDGRELEVAANIGNARDAETAVSHGADGVGLLRSEFLFLGRREAPSQSEQAEQFTRIAKALGPDRSLVVRTLDVGGDKPLSFMPVAEEENPFLGIRGLRLSLKFPDAFKAHLRAILSAAKHTKLSIMFPMVAQVAEFREAKALALDAMNELGVENVSLGIMVEVPSAALLADSLAKEADFFSIGTNDLTQYTLAMDRGHAELAAQADALHPSVLRLIEVTAQAARAEGKWVGVCGGLAAESLALPLLVGLGIDELSVPAPAIPSLKARIRQLSTDACRAIAEEALASPDAKSVRALLKGVLF